MQQFSTAAEDGALFWYFRSELFPFSVSMLRYRCCSWCLVFYLPQFKAFDLPDDLTDTFSQRKQQYSWAGLFWSRMVIKLPWVERAGVHVPIWILFLKHTYSSVTLKYTFLSSLISVRLISGALSHISRSAHTTRLFSYHFLQLDRSFVWLSLEESVQFCTKWCSWHTTLYFCE